MAAIALVLVGRHADGGGAVPLEGSNVTGVTNAHLGKDAVLGCNTQTTSWHHPVAGGFSSDVRRRTCIAMPSGH